MPMPDAPNDGWPTRRGRAQNDAARKVEQERIAAQERGYKPETPKIPSENVASKVSGCYSYRCTCNPYPPKSGKGSATEEGSGAELEQVNPFSHGTADT
jgi:hypothetical protein